MIENRSYTSPVFTCDKQGRVRTWPLLAEELDPWVTDVPTDPLPVLVPPGVLHDPMLEVER